MKILTVVFPESVKRVHVYSKEIENDMIEEVEEAFEELNIQVEPEVVEEVADLLEHGKHYWYDEQLCFEVIEPR